MKTRYKVAIVLLAILAITGLNACATASGSTGGEQTASAETDATRVVFGVRKPKHVGVSLMSARNMLSGEAEQSADRVDIVACGPAIRALATDSKFADRVREGLSKGIRMKACGVTVERMGFDASTFVEGVEVVPNGFVELMRLQEKGFHSVEL
jgi:hypothetical protein